MTQEELQAKYDRLVDKVRRYRGWQKQYLKYHSSSDLEKIKQYAREVDRLIAEEVKKQESKQKEIF